MSAELPEVFHVLRISGTPFYIDADARREIEVFLRGAPGPFDIITVDTLLGEELTVAADYIGPITSSTLATRAADRVFCKRINDEVPIEERE